MSIRIRFVGALVACVSVLAAPINAAYGHASKRHAGSSRAAAGHGVDVHAVRLWAGPDNTRIVLDLSGSAQHSLAVLSNPERVVLDVPGARLGTGAQVPAAIGAIKQMRMAKRPSGELRIVFDLSHSVCAMTFLANPNRQ
jgi:N-acetylmuramoyl-L-alanine amidase